LDICEFSAGGKLIVSTTNILFTYSP